MDGLLPSGALGWIPGNPLFMSGLDLGARGSNSVRQGPDELSFLHFFFLPICSIISEHTSFADRQIQGFPVILFFALTRPFA